MFALFIKKVIEIAVSIIISLSANQTTTTKVTEKPVNTTTVTTTTTKEKTTKKKKVEKKETKQVQKTVQINRIPSHLYVNNIDVEVVQINPTSTYQLQLIVNDPYKAACYQYEKCLYIGDHSDQSFWSLPQVKVGDKMYWQNKVYKCYYVDDYGYLDQTGHIRLSNNKLLYEFECIALVTCKTDYTRYIRLFKEE